MLCEKVRAYFLIYPMFDTERRGMTLFTVKLLGACLLALAGWYGGVAVCHKVTAHRVALGEMVALLKVLEEEISFRRANLNDVYQRLARSNAFAALGLSAPLCEGQVQGETASFQSLPSPCGFSKEETTAFLECFARLGYTGALQECERLARYRKQFEAFHLSAVQSERSALAIDRKIGLALGSMVALMLL